MHDDHSNYEYCQPTLWYYGYVDTGRRLLDLCLIILFSCVHIWTHPIITKNINYLSLWFFSSWYVSEINLLTKLIILRHRKPVTCSSSIWWSGNFLLNNCVMIPMFCCVASESQYLALFLFFVKILDKGNYWVFHIIWTTGVHCKLFLKGKI